GGISGGPADPIFGRPLAFYFFTLPAWQAIVAWLLSVGVIVMVMSLFFLAVGGGLRAIAGRSVARSAQPGLRCVAFAWAFLLLILAAQTWLGRYDRLFAEHTIFSGASYTDVYVTITFATIAAFAFVAGAAIAIASGATTPRVRWLVGAIVPAVLTYLV